MRTLLIILFICITIAIVIVPTGLYYGLKVSPLSWHLLGPTNENSGLVLKGYDVVSYFYDNKAQKGDTTKGIKHNNNIQYFSSDENKLMFKTFPEKFQAQYGGYCANAIASGFTADVNPEVWHIENGKLYLFFDESNKYDFISKIGQGIIEQADIQWAQR